jgi:hypothetical protein
VSIFSPMIGTQVVQHVGARREGFDQRALNRGKLIASAEISFDTRDQVVELFDSAERLAEPGAVQQLRLRFGCSEHIGKRDCVDRIAKSRHKGAKQVGDTSAQRRVSARAYR